MSIVWIFNGTKLQFPSGVFTQRETAELWILQHGLSGTLTAYPVNVGTYDWALSGGHFTPKRDDQRSAEFIQRFSSASQEHYHYEHGNAANHALQPTAERSGGASVTDESSVQCHHQQGVVTLTCGQEAFARLVAAVATAAGPAAAAAGVEVIVIKRPDPTPPPTPPWLDLLLGTGCAAAAVTVVLLLGAGAYTLSKWVWLP